MTKLILHSILLIIGVNLHAQSSAEHLQLTNPEKIKVVTESYPAEWKYIKTFQVENQVTFEDEVVTKIPVSGFTKKTIGEAAFRLIEVEGQVQTKFSKLYERDNAILNIEFANLKKGLPFQDVYAVKQMADGRMILTDHNGFHIYDGRIIHSFYPGEMFGKVRGFFAGTDEKMWMATTKGVFFFKEGQLYQLSTISNEGFWRCFEDAEGVIWLTSFAGGVYLIEDATVFQLTKMEDFEECKAVTQDKSGNHYLSAPTGVYEMTLTDTFLYPFDNEIGQTEKLFCWDGTVLLGRYGKGLYVLDSGVFKKVFINAQDFSIYSFDTTSSGLWLNSYGKGIVHISHDWKFMNITQNEGLIGNAVHKLAADDFGNVWMGDLFDGFSVFKESMFKRTGDPAWMDEVYQIEEKNDTFYFFVNKGYPFMLAGQDLYQLHSDELGYGTIYYRHGDVSSSQNLWLETYGKGPLKFENNQFTYHIYSDIPQEANGHYPRTDKWGRMWFLNFRNQLICHSDNVVMKFPALDSLVIDQLIKDPQNDVYFTANNQFYIFKSQNELEKSGIFSHPKERILRIGVHEKEGVWVITNQFLYHLAKGVCINQLPVTMPVDIEIHSLLQKNNQLYFTSNKGLLIYELEKGVQSLNVIGKHHGSFTALRSNIFSCGDELLYTSNFKNYWFKPNWNTEVNKKGSIKKVTFSIDGQEVEEPLLIEAEKELKVEVQIHNWGKNRLDHYRVFQNNNAQDWQTFENTISLSNLAAGEYHLEIKTTNLAGDSEVFKSSFEVMPYWYQSNWSYLFFGCIILILSYVVYKKRLSWVEKRNQELEATVEAKTKELKKEKEVVEEQLSQKELLLKEINHRVKNNMQMVNSLLELQKSREQSQKNKDALSKVSQRVKALSIAHQQLYMQTQYEKIDIHDYLQIVISKLLTNITCECEVSIQKEIMIPIEKGQALGLVVNELISNSLKHAWPKVTDDLKLSIFLKTVNNKIELVYKDNGPGFDLEKVSSRSLGMTLIDSFITRQLNGHYTIDTDKHFAITLSFEL